MMETILADNKRPPDLFLLMVIGSDTHRVLLCDLREIADECGTLDDLLRRAVAGEDRMLVEREERLERCAPERVELHPELLKKIDRNARALPFLWFFGPGSCRFAPDNVDGLNHARIEVLLDPDRDIERRAHPALVLADRAARHPEYLPEITQRHAAPLAEIPQGIAVDVHVQPAGGGVDERRDLLHKIIVQRRDADRVDAVPDIDRPPLELGLAGSFPDDQGHAAQVLCNHVKIERCFLAHRVDMHNNFYHEQGPVVTCDEVKTSRAEGKLLGYFKSRRYHHAGDQLELAFLRHAVTNGWSVPIY